MHVTFRELAQQMGMQTVRAILEEDIDILLNGEIINTTREILLANVQQTPYIDKVIRQNSVIAPINAIRTLYTSGKINVPNKTNVSEDDPYKVTISDSSVMMYTGFKVTYNDYHAGSVFDCRIIEAEDLGQTIRDFCNRPAPDAPIVVVNKGANDNEISVEIYTGRNINTYTGKSNWKQPISLKYLYIKNPAKVNIETGVSCDLPSYLHYEIVQRAVQTYLISIGATSRTNGNQQQNNQ